MKRNHSSSINYLPAEEPDAQEVITLIKAEGRIALAIAGDLKMKRWRYLLRTAFRQPRYAPVAQVITAPACLRVTRPLTA
jgi:hypothetical protein